MSEGKNRLATRRAAGKTIADNARLFSEGLTLLLSPEVIVACPTSDSLALP